MIGEGRDLSEVGDDHHLMVVGQRGQSPAYGRGHGSTDAGVDLVEHERRRRLTEHQSQGQHRAGQLSSRCHLGERQRRRAWVRRQKEHDIVSRVGIADAHLDLGVGHGQGSQHRLHAPGERAGSSAA